MSEDITPVFGAIFSILHDTWDVEITKHGTHRERIGYACALADVNRLASLKDMNVGFRFYDMPEALDPDKRNVEVRTDREHLRAAWTAYVATPGHPIAVEHGCECPVLDNAHGKGVKRYGGELCFTINGGCPLHGRGDWS